MNTQFSQKLVLFLLASISLCAAPKTPDWQPTYFVWGMGMFLEIDTLPCDYHFGSRISNYTEIYNMPPGSTLFIQLEQLQDFYSNVLPNIPNPFILFVGHSDLDFPTGLKSAQSKSYCLNPKDVLRLLNHPNIIHIFAQNNALSEPHSKVTSFPIGVDFHTSAIHGIPADRQEACLFEILDSAPPTSSRKKGILIDFHFRDTLELRNQRLGIKGELNRLEIAELLSAGLVGDLLPNRIDRTDLWKRKTEYAFSASPHGHGLDCHRTWEDLILGCIVIVKTSTLDSLYEGLPVAIVDDWSDVTQEKLDDWIEEFGDTLSNPDYWERLTHDYWMEMMNNVQLQYLQTHGNCDL